MNLASALIKRVLELGDFDTWANVRRHYLPSEYHRLFDIITKHTDLYHKLPTLEELRLEVRDSATIDKVYALDTIQVDAEPYLLLDYLKSEFAQRETLYQFDKYLDESIAFDNAEEVVRKLQQIGLELETKVEIGDPEDSMQKINLFDSDEEIAGRITLGLNAEFDIDYQFRDTDYILMGGVRGTGKSITCNNVADHIMKTKNKSVVYFSIEMPAREVLQRACAIATQIPFLNIRNKKLSEIEWEKVVRWWATRYKNSEKHIETYLSHHDFNRFHTALSKEPLSDVFLDVVYDPHLTLSRINIELSKRKAQGQEIGACIVDYINQIEPPHGARKDGQYDWKYQIEISKGLKRAAQLHGFPFFSPYQIDNTGEARFAKGILDAADCSMILKKHKDCMTFTITKMRNMNDELVITSTMNWPTLTIGPDTVPTPVEEEKHTRKAKKVIGKPTGESIYEDTGDPPF